MTGTSKFVFVRIEILKFLQPLNVLWEGCIERIVADVQGSKFWEPKNGFNDQTIKLLWAYI